MNRAARRLGVRFPIVQAPIGSATTPALAAAVSNAGGLGMLAGSWRSPAELVALIHETKALTPHPFGVNLVLAFDPGERLRASLEAGVRIISFFWGDPAPWIPLVHQAGGIAIHAAGSRLEAAEAAAAGVDLLVAQGVEAGGHVRGTTPLEQLTGEVRDVATNIPVLAAGGIATAEDARRAIANGVDGVWVGTRFVASEESRAHVDYKERIVAASAADTELGTTFDIGWPGAPHRALRNSTVRGRGTGRRPGEGEIIARYANGRPIVRYEDTIPLEGMSGNLEALALYAGMSVDGITDVLPAATIVDRLSTAFT